MKLLLLICLIQLFTFAARTESRPLSTDYNPCLNPVVMIPGLGASVLDVYLTNEYKYVHVACEIVFPRNKWTSGINRLWPAAEAISIPGETFRDCWENMMTMQFNSTSLKFSNQPGMLVRPRDYGGVDGVGNIFAFVGDWGPTGSSVYYDLIERLKKSPGYAVGMNIRGAPYDFRMVADKDYLAEAYLDLRTLIEDTYDMTQACPSGPRKVHVTTHSLGGPYYLYFLNSYVTQEWKDKYLETFLSFSSPWLGSTEAYRTIISGDTEGIPGKNYVFVPFEKSLGGLLWMIPYPSYFPNQYYIQVGQQNYTASFDPSKSDSMDALFKLLPLDRSDAMIILRELIAPRIETIDAPNTTVYCIYGTGVPTESFDMYESANDTNKDPYMYREPYIVNGKVVLSGASPELLLPLNEDSIYAKDPNQGDHVVELPSLKHCNNWIGNNGGYDMIDKQFPGFHHVSMLREKTFLDYIMQLIDQYNVI